VFRRRKERVDSVNETILRDRAMHAERMEEVYPSASIIDQIEKLRLGRRKNWHSQKQMEQRRRAAARRQAGVAGELSRSGGALGYEAHLNREGLAEVAVFGHSNCGKSALINTLVAQTAARGPAKVHDRPGWTARLHFYRVRPPAGHGAGPAARAVAIVDTPGYGFAVGEKAQLKQWQQLLDGYIQQSARLALALILVDSTRGVCAADCRLLGKLHRASVPTLPVLTKTDLLSPERLAQSHAVVTSQLDAVHSRWGPGPSTWPGEIALVSAHFFGGVDELWRRILDGCGERDEAT
jgi:GTP-binding protein